MMKELVAHDADMVHIGTDVGEHWVGWEELQAATEDQFETLKAYKATLRDLQINLSRSGNVAWYAHLLDATIVSKRG